MRSHSQCILEYRMFLLHGDSKYIDVLERSLYNNVISEWDRMVPPFSMPIRWLVMPDTNSTRGFNPPALVQLFLFVRPIYAVSCRLFRYIYAQKEK